MKLRFNQEERRRQAAEAAEKRHREADARGLKDPEGYKRKVEQREKIEREAALAGGGEGKLKVGHAYYATVYDKEKNVQSCCYLHINI